MKLTKEMLQWDNRILHSEVCLIPNPWSGSKPSIRAKCVVCKWVIDDWTIYQSYCSNTMYMLWTEDEEVLNIFNHELLSDDFVAKSGDKIWSIETIKSIVERDEEVLKRYRF